MGVAKVPTDGNEVYILGRRFSPFGMNMWGPEDSRELPFVNLALFGFGYLGVWPFESKIRYVPLVNFSVANFASGN